AVYGREGEPCTHCGAPLQSVRIGGRATIYCSRCQR
ncbi:DNA-formamidopyrimidine glycosylase, partial [Acidithiobacillus ferrooxidans]|nr:DNA-formamidopyrimidine glycosylase [Acidithiobacillus ferrooxidans]